MISILLMQDIVAIFVLLLLHSIGTEGLQWLDFGIIIFAFPGLFVVALLLERFVLVKLLSRYDRVQEYVFLLSIGWCLGFAELARLVGLSEDIGAFIGGVSIAASPIALYISESLKPLRDFFLVMFFFSIGASFNLQYLHIVLLPAVILATIMLLVKPATFRVLLHQAKETKHIAWEVGVRVGQVSEFSLLVAYLATQMQLIGQSASYLIQATTMLTFVASSYIVVLKYPTPLAFSDNMRRD
jgi:Kef-type K+ transport system membrane component KefB